MIILFIVLCCCVNANGDFLFTPIDEDIAISKLNPFLDTSSECEVYTDCFNCTLSNCAWTAATESCYDEEGSTEEIHVSGFFNFAFECGDPLNLCLALDFEGYRHF